MPIIHCCHMLYIANFMDPSFISLFYLQSTVLKYYILNIYIHLKILMLSTWFCIFFFHYPDFHHLCRLLHRDTIIRESLSPVLYVYASHIITSATVVKQYNTSCKLVHIHSFQNKPGSTYLKRYKILVT